MDKPLGSSELIINNDGSIFHLHLKPNEIADDILLVGDPKRVDLIASFFQEKHVAVSNREFYAITGSFNGKLITALSTGIGTDNIDIVLSELDALANIDFSSRRIKQKRRSLRLIRIGTSGAIQPDIVPGTIVASKYVIGFDGLLNFYKARNHVCLLDMEKSFTQQCDWPNNLHAPYCVEADSVLWNRMIDDSYAHGITISANGFYGPQGRELRAELAYPELFMKLPEFSFNAFKASNFEMECSALYGLSKILGHQALTICVIIANRSLKSFIGDYSRLMNSLVNKILINIAND